PGIAFADLWHEDVPAWLREVSAPGNDADVVIVSPHWGPNMRAEPVAHVRRAAAALQAAGTIIEGRPQPVRADTGAGAAPRRRSGAMPAATGAGARAVAGAGTGAAAGAGTAGAGERAAPPLVSTEVDTVRMKSLGETPAATPQTGGAANPEDAKQKRTTLPGIGIDKKGFVEGDADTPPGGVPVRPTER
ncbi:MAG TPA: hypothetical protein VG389_24555, partial [Myxococcota bacterium]|nr:hypothetical protein [Myxococcota bacterium]